MRKLADVITAANEPLSDRTEFACVPTQLQNSCMETKSYKAEGCAINQSFRSPISHHFFWEIFPKPRLVNEVQLLDYHIYHTILITLPPPHTQTHKTMRFLRQTLRYSSCLSVNISFSGAQYAKGVVETTR